MKRCIVIWKKGIEGAKTLRSEKRFNDALHIHATMRAVWPGEREIKDLREHIVHW